MYNISFFSRFVFDEFINKWGEYVNKVSKTLANRMDERRNMINYYLRGELALRVLGGVLILSFSYSSELFFTWFCHFSCPLLAFAVF
jgi:hypothetical protein